MTAPKYIVDAINAMKEERGPLAARLDAIDLAIDNISRVYGLHGTPQPLPLERRSGPRRGAGKRKVAPDTGEASQRQDALLSAIAKSAVGLTLAELRRSTPKMDGKDRSNALQRLKAGGKIARRGNTWVTAA